MEARLARGRAHARAALVGNPSDGYGGRTLATTLAEFAAEVTIEPGPLLEIVPGDQDRNTFRDLDELVADVRANGYYGGLRLVRAALKRFAEHCAGSGAGPPHSSFRVHYSTSIPRQVGLGGSSAIVIATLRALAEFHGVELAPDGLARLALATETEELEIPAGPQDRFVQAHEGVLYMDFSGDEVEVQRLDPAAPPPLFLAYRADASEPSAIVHAELRRRFDAGDATVRAAMAELAELAVSGRVAIRAGDGRELGALMDRSFELRRRIQALDPRHERMIEIARAHGAAANYAGSGGAIVGVCPEGANVADLQAALAADGCAMLELSPGRRARSESPSGA
jgi:glucuronokinase